MATSPSKSADAILAEIADELNSIFANYACEPGADGKPQAVLPGAERVTQADLAQARANAPLKPKAIQRPCDAGLFSDQSQQKELF